MNIKTIILFYLREISKKVFFSFAFQDLVLKSFAALRLKCKH